MKALRPLRLRSGLTQAQVARAAGLCTTSYRNIEAGRYFPWPETLALIARAIGAGLGRPLDVNELLGHPGLAPASALRVVRDDAPTLSIERRSSGDTKLGIEDGDEPRQRGSAVLGEGQQAERPVLERD